MALVRPTKEGGATTYQGKVALGFKDILASEADADHDTMYAAWNGTLGGDLTGTLPNPTVVAAVASKWTVSGTTLTPTDATKTVSVPGGAAGAGTAMILLGSNTSKVRLQTDNTVPSPALLALAANRNAVTGVVDDTTKSAWQLMLNPNGDNFTIGRQPAGGSYSNLLTLDSAGNLILATPGILTKAHFQVGGAGSTCWLSNYTISGALDDNTKPSWQINLGNADLCAWYRAPAGSASNTLLGNFDPAGNWVIYGSIGQKASGTTWSNPSDPRLKQDVAPYVAGLAEIAQLEPITYRLKAQPDGPLCYGFDAEKVRDVFPECVSETRMKLDPADEEETDGVLTFDMHPILVALINAVKELAQKVP